MAGLCGGGDATTKQVDRDLKNYKKRMESQINLLLLGAGESGKSTVAKQMRILHLDGFTPEESAGFRVIIYSNVISTVKTLAQQARLKGFKGESRDVDDAMTRVIEVKNAEAMSPELWADIKLAWRDPALQKVWDTPNPKFHIIDSAKHWYVNLDRISDPSFVPSQDDILHARQMTTGIVEIEWDHNGTHFKMVDVGGQRNHRSKWIHCFDGVTAVIFCIGLSEYDQVLREDENMNRMHESLNLFESLVNSEWFFKTPFVIFFNKRDLFAEKIKKVDLNVCWPEYQDGRDYDKATEFIAKKFTSTVETGLNGPKNNDRGIYPHFTCATDTDNIRTVFDAVKDILLRRQLAVFG